MTTSTTPRTRRLTGHLGPVGIVFMVVAAAAPLTVIGGNMPLAMGLGNGAGAPVGFVIAALVLLVFSIGFVTMTPMSPRQAPSSPMSPSVSASGWARASRWSR